MSKHNYSTKMLVPKIEKIVVNMGVGDALANSRMLEAAVSDLEKITGQKAVETTAKKSISSPDFDSETAVQNFACQNE
jgi:large subunit ribosomal protein L5